ncbi:MAG TPA: hypothetical protein VIV27_09050 [Halioglobus sp.]
MKILRILLILIGSVSLIPVFAADKDRKYHVRVIDAVGSCERLNSALAKAKTEDDWGALYGFSLYTMGYITGINRTATNTYDIAGKKNSKTLMVWLQQYCDEHPQDSFDYALYRLTVELYPDRITLAPE